MRVITLDGPSKVGKTCAGKHLAAELQQSMQAPIRFDSIGDFFRRMTVGIIEAVGPAPEEPEMLDQLAKVIDTDMAFDNGRTWPDLHSKEVDDLVSTVGVTPLAQTTKRTWSERATAIARSEQVGLWVVDGRNPRRTLQDELRRPNTHLVLDLFVHCDVEPAALRAGVPLEQLERRRRQDLSGPDPLLVYPQFPVPYEPVSTESWPEWFAEGYVDSTEDSVIASSWAEGGQVPTPVLLDTSELGISDPDRGLDRMLTATTKLAHRAIAWYNHHDV